MKHDFGRVLATVFSNRETIRFRPLHGLLTSVLIQHRAPSDTETRNLTPDPINGILEDNRTRVASYVRNNERKFPRGIVTRRVGNGRG